MKQKEPNISTAILILKDHKVLLGLLSKKWLFDGKQVYGVPGRSIHFGEKIGDAVARDIDDDLGVSVTSHKIIAVNANYALRNHYIEIGVLAEINGEIQNRKPEDWVVWEWHELSEIPGNIFPSAANVIESYRKKAICVSE